MSSDEKLLVTVILRHDQSKTLDEILEHTKMSGFYRDFPPEGTELVSWVVAMSYGFIIQLRLKATACKWRLSAYHFINQLSYSRYA